VKHGHCHKGNVGKYSLHGASGYAWEHPKSENKKLMLLLNDSENPVGANFAPLGSSKFFTWIILRTIVCLVGWTGGVLLSSYPKGSMLQFA